MAHTTTHNSAALLLPLLLLAGAVGCDNPPMPGTPPADTSVWGGMDTAALARIAGTWVHQDSCQATYTFDTARTFHLVSTYGAGIELSGPVLGINDTLLTVGWMLADHFTYYELHYRLAGDSLYLNTFGYIRQ